MDDELRRIQDIAEEMFNSQRGLEGLSLLVPKTQAIFQVRFRNDKEKDIFREVFTQYCKLNRIVRFFLVGEKYIHCGASELLSTGDRKWTFDRNVVLSCSLFSITGIETVAARIVTEGRTRTLGYWEHSHGDVESPYWIGCLYRPWSN